MPTYHILEDQLDRSEINLDIQSQGDYIFQGDQILALYWRDKNSEDTYNAVP